MKALYPTLLASYLVSTLVACGGGVPVQIRIDEFDLELSLDDAVGTMEDELRAKGLLPPGSAGLPEVWPDSLPDVVGYEMPVTTDPVPVDLNPDPDSEEAAKYEDINKAKNAIRRIEINRLILRVEQSNLTVALPQMTLQVADQMDANPDDRTAWFSVGTIPGVEPGALADLEFEWLTGGESFLNAQLGDEAKKFAIRTTGRLSVDTTANPHLPYGKAELRLIVVATFFVEPEKIW